MGPTEELRHEHDIILVVLSAAEKQAAIGTPEPGTIREMVDFFVNFVDRCHHTKEEKYLFPKMEERGVPREGGPIGVMLGEHDDGRRLVGEIRKSVSGGGPGQGQTRKPLLAYVSLLRSHIDKENNVLFPMADKRLTQEDQESLHKAFEKVEAEEIGEGVHEKYHEMAHRLHSL